MTWEFTDFFWQFRSISSRARMYQSFWHYYTFLTVLRIFIFFDIFWHFLTSFDTFWHLLIFFDIYWYFLTFLTVFLTFFWLTDRPTDQPTDRPMRGDVEAPTTELKNEDKWKRSDSKDNLVLCLKWSPNKVNPNIKL